MFTILSILNAACLIAAVYTMRTEFLFAAGLILVLQSLLMARDEHILKQIKKPTHKPPGKSITNGKSKKKKSN